MKTLEELKRGLVCLVPKPGVEMPSCHEYSVCDCTVLDLLSDLEAMREALAEISDDSWDLRLGPHHWDRARECLSDLKFGKEAK